MDDTVAEELARLKTTLLSVTGAKDPCPELGLVMHLATRIAERSPELKQRWGRMEDRSREDRSRIVKNDIRALLRDLGAQVDDPDEVADWGIAQCNAMLGLVANNLSFLDSTSYSDYLTTLDQIIGLVYQGRRHTRMIAYLAEFARSEDMKIVGQFHANSSVGQLRWLNEGPKPLSYDTTEAHMAIYLRGCGIYERDLLFLQGLIDTAYGNRTTYDHLVSRRLETDSLVGFMKSSRYSIFATPWDRFLRNAAAHGGFSIDLGQQGITATDRDKTKQYTYTELCKLSAEMSAAVLSCRLLPCLVSKQNWVHFKEIAGGRQA
jgi:hypothetical protein